MKSRLQYRVKTRGKITVEIIQQNIRNIILTEYDQLAQRPAKVWVIPLGRFVRHWISYALRERGNGRVVPLGLLGVLENEPHSHAKLKNTSKHAVRKMCTFMKKPPIVQFIFIFLEIYFFNIFLSRLVMWGKLQTCRFPTFYWEFINIERLWLLLLLLLVLLLFSLL